MLKKLNNILNVLIGASVGVFIGHSIYRYFDCRKYSDLYEIQSAPLYASIIVYGSVTTIVLLIVIILKYVIKRKLTSK